MPNQAFGKNFHSIKATPNKIVFVSPRLTKGLLVTNRSVGEIVYAGEDGFLDIKNDLEFYFSFKKDDLWLKMGKVQEFTLEVKIVKDVKNIKLGEFLPNAFFPRRLQLDQEDIAQAWSFVGPLIRELKAFGVQAG